MALLKISVILMDINNIYLKVNDKKVLVYE